MVEHVSGGLQDKGRMLEGEREAMEREEKEVKKEKKVEREAVEGEKEEIKEEMERERT